MAPLPLSDRLLRCALPPRLLGREVGQVPGGPGHVDGGGPGGDKEAQRVPDEGQECSKARSPGARLQLHGEAEAAHEGNGWGAAHLEGELGASGEQQSGEPPPPQPEPRHATPPS